MTIFTRILLRLHLIFCRFVKLVYAQRHGISIKQGVSFCGIPVITAHKHSLIELGERVVLVSSAAVADLGISRGTILRTSRPNAKIIIGADSGLTGTVICAAVSVTIGRECLFGANVTIADTDFHPIAPANRRYERDPAKIKCRPIVIGNNVFVGTQAIILKGVTIGDNAVIGAGAVVSTDIPANTIAAGNPAKVIRAL